MIKHLINREGTNCSFIFYIDRNILQNCIVNFSKSRTYKNEGRRNYKLSIPSDQDLSIKFDSRFENGNLWKAVKLPDNEYNLVLLNDFNTSGHTQWYYFKIHYKIKPGMSRKLKLNIVNLSKPDSLSNEGMKPCVKSLKKMETEGTGWHRDCDQISYKMNTFLKNKDRKPDPSNYSNFPLWTYYYYTLSFTYEMPYDEDTVYFAHAVPYTYNYDLIPFLNKLAYNQPLNDENSESSTSGTNNSDCDYSEFLRIGTLCKTLAGNH
jgi:hypothetical protein